jgi:hypothetical protein
VAGAAVVAAARVRFAGTLLLLAGAVAREAVRFRTGASGVFAAAAFLVAFAGACLAERIVDVAAPRAERRGAPVLSPDGAVAVRARARRGAGVAAARGAVLRARRFGVADTPDCSTGLSAAAASRAGVPLGALSSAAPSPR